MAATGSEAVPRIEIVGERRRAHDVAFRKKMVAESVVAGARVQDVAQRNGICPSLVYRWRRAAEANRADGSAMRLFPLGIAASPDMAQTPSTPAATPLSVATPRRSGLIEIELAGGVRVSVDEDVSLAALRRMISVLRKR